MDFSVDSGPKFAGTLSSNAGGIARDRMSFRFSISCPFRRYSRSKSEVVENRPKFCMFLACHFFLGGGGVPLEFLDLIYLFPSFRSCGKVSRRSVEGRRREAGERNKKKKKTSRVKRKTSRTTVTGGLISVKRSALKITVI